MFFEGHRIDAMREMILSDTVEGRRDALNKILPMQRGDFEGILEAMNGLGLPSVCSTHLYTNLLRTNRPHNNIWLRNWEFR